MTYSKNFRTELWQNYDLYKLFNFYDIITNFSIYHLLYNCYIFKFVKVLIWSCFMSIHLITKSVKYSHKKTTKIIWNIKILKEMKNYMSTIHYSMEFPLNSIHLCQWETNNWMSKSRKKIFFKLFVNDIINIVMACVVWNV